MVEPISNLRFDVDGQAFFLHHSKNEIKVGDRIRTTNPGSRQATATDAILGHSYGWDARTGLNDALANQISLRGNFATGEKLEDFSVYLTSANAKDVYPDINVPGSSARAIKSEQNVIDSVRISGGISDEQGKNLIKEMTQRHGIFEAKDSVTKGIIDNSILASKGDEALGNFLEGHGENVILGHIKNIKKQMQSGGRKGVYQDYADKVVSSSARPSFGPDLVGHLRELGKTVEESGDEAAFDFAKKKWTAEYLKLNTQGLSAEIQSKAIGTTQAMVEKAVNAKSLIAKAQSSTTGMLNAANEASQAVAGGVAKSGLLRQAGAALSILRRRA